MFVSNTFVRSVLSVHVQARIFVQRCSCFRTLKAIILRTKPEHNAAGDSGGAESGKGESHYGTSLQFQRRPQHAARKVLKQAQAELLEYGSSGQSVMEMSHRSKWFDAIITETEASLRRVMNIPDNYKVGFFQGGATQQFAMVPLNFMTTGKADYLVTGNFSNLAASLAARPEKLPDTM